MEILCSTYRPKSYLFAFNGQEKTNEITGEGNHLDFKFRGYDSRLGRFWSVDPLCKSYPWNSPYSFAENDVIEFIDLEGKEKGTQPAQETKYGTTTAIDNTLPPFTPKELEQQNATPPNPGEIKQYQPNYVEDVKNYFLTVNKNDGYIVKIAKAIGLIAYNSVNDPVVYAQQVLCIPARDLEGHGKDPKEIQDAGINTIQSIMPIEKMTALLPKEALEVVNYSTYVGNVLKSSASSMSRAQKGELLLQHNFVATLLPKCLSDASISKDIAGFSSEIIKAQKDN